MSVVCRAKLHRGSAPKRNGKVDDPAVFYATLRKVLFRPRRLPHQAMLQLLVLPPTQRLRQNPIPAPRD